MRLRDGMLIQEHRMKKWESCLHEHCELTRRFFFGMGGVAAAALKNERRPFRIASRNNNVTPLDQSDGMTMRVIEDPSQRNASVSRPH